MLSIKCTVHRV